MIQLKQNNNSKKGEYNICIDDSSYAFGWAYKTNLEENSYQYFANGATHCSWLIKQSIEDFEPFSVITFNNIFAWMKHGHSIIISNEIDEENGNTYLQFSFYFSPNLAFWNEDYSFVEYFNEFSKNFEDLVEGDYEIMFEEEPALRLEFNVSKFQTSLEGVILSFGEDLKIAHEQTKLFFQERLQLNLVQSVFNFPEELKVPCKQYLEYFAQFLQDLGINATSNLKEEAGKVLFSVTPTDDIEALDIIREALAIYLSLASNPIPHSTGDRTVEMVLSGGRANAKHLESQLELAIAKLQFKEATLELKDATIEQNQFALRQKDETIKELQEIISRGNIFEESLERVEINGEVFDASSLYRFSREDDIEVEATPILDESNKETRIGLVKVHEVTKFKDYGVSFDLPKAIRGLIDYVKKDKNSR